MSRRFVGFVGAALIAALALHCSPADEEPASPPPTPKAFRVLGTHDDYATSAALEVVASVGSRVYARQVGVGRCPSGVFSVDAAATDLAPLETLVDPDHCAGGFGIENGTLYTVFGSVGVHACPLDAPCGEGQKIASFLKHVFDVGVSAGKVVVLSCSSFTDTRPSDLVTFDIAGGRQAPHPLTTFEPGARPFGFAIHGGDVYYVRITNKGSASKGEDQTLERVPIDGSSPPKVLASRLSFVSGIVVDEKGIVLLESGSSKKIRTVPLEGGEARTLIEVANASTLGHATTATSVVVVIEADRSSTFVRYERSTGVELARTPKLPFQAAARFIASEADVTFGGVDPNTQRYEGAFSHVSGVIVRAPLGTK